MIVCDKTKNGISGLCFAVMRGCHLERGKNVRETDQRSKDCTSGKDNR